jgi:pre-mRNA cleavage complex 2 protein Pcf11
MLAYSQVDQNIRRKLEEMLKTWREPVPGSTSAVPVFPIMSTQPIVDALNRFRAAVPQPRPASRPQTGIRITQPQYATPPPSIAYPYAQQQQASPVQQMVPQYQQLPQTNYQPPTPQYQTHLPQQQYQPPISQAQYRISTPQPQYQAPTPQPQYLQPVPNQQYQQPVQRPTSSSGAIDMKKLHADIEDLTIDAKIECSTAPMDQGAQKKLASLQSLKELLDSNAMSETDLVAIRDSVMQQMAKKMAPHRPTPPIPQPYHAPYPMQQHYPGQQAQQPPPVSVTPLINSANLAELLRTTANRGQQQNGAVPSIQFPQNNAYTSTPPVQTATPAPPAGENPLLAQLRASGLLSALPTPPAGSTPQAGTPSAQSTAGYEPTIQFTTASIRIPRPGLLQAFLSRNPNQCTTCGRRFASDEVGKDKKARHLDWHFKTKTRMIEAERRGVSRSWYVDEREWIASREVDDDQEAENSTKKENGTTKAAAQQDWVLAPTDPAVRNLPCPIDQEGWKSEWSEEMQEFLWRDAVKVGGRYYHASCYRDVMKGRSERVATPDSVLGKRTRDEEGSVGGSGVKKERFKVEV